MRRSFVSVSKAVSASYVLTITDPTGISEIVNSKLSNSKWFDLQGRKANTLSVRKGVYVVDGRKVTIK
jgi:hypothetical protein